MRNRERVLFLGVVLLTGCPKKNDDVPPPLPSAAETTAPPPATVNLMPNGGTTAGAEGAAPATLSAAIDGARPQMKDSSNAPDDGSATLLKWWLEKNYPWAQMEAIPETTETAFLAGPDPLRGKRLCTTGTIKQIQQTSAAPRENEGMIQAKDGSLVSFGAVGDVTGMTLNGQGRFCGIASGIESTTGPDGKPGRAVRVVGYFDTPANHGGGGGGGQFASLKACCQALQQNSVSMPPPQNLYAASAAQYCLASVAAVSNPQQKDALLAGIRGMLKGVPIPAMCH